MLTCKQVAARASAMIDGELGFFDHLQMRLHLMMCGGCDTFVKQMRITRDLMKSAVSVDNTTAQEDDACMTAILGQLRDKKQTGP